MFSTKAISLLGLLAAPLLVPALSHRVVAQDPQLQADGAPQVAPSDVRQLLKQLEANELALRDEAERKLVGAGATVLPLLPEITARTSGEMKVRLQRIRQTLQKSEVETFFEASTVTLQGKMSVAEAIAAIQDQTGNPIEIQGEGESTQVELNCTDETFWTVIGQLLEQASMRLAAFGTTNNALVLSPADGVPEGGPQPFVSGPFRVDAISTRTTLPLAYSMGGQLECSYYVSWEPRLKPVFMQIPMASVQATLDEEAQLAATNPAATPEIALNLGGCTTQVDVQLDRPPRSTEKLASLSGEFVMAVPGERHKYVFKKFGNGARQSEKYGDVTVTLEGSRRNQSLYEMRILTEFADAQGALDSFRGWILSNEAYLLDSKSVRLDKAAFQTYAVTSNAVGIAYLFELNGDPNDFDLVYESPATMSKQTVRFELSDIPLP